MLESVGLTAEDESVYETLLSVRPATLPDLVRETSLPRRQVVSSLASLEERGLVSRTTGRAPRYVPAPPDVALDGLVYRQQAELERVRLYGQQLLERFNRAHEAAGLRIVEVIRGREAVYRWAVQLQKRAKHEVMALSRPPYAAPTVVSSVERDLLERGVRYRYIYDRSSLEVPGLVEAVGRDISAGEEARVVRDLPLKLSIADDSLAIVALSTSDAVDGAVVVYSSPLLRALRFVFETLWETAIPWASAVGSTPSAPEGEVSLEEARLLTLIAAGTKDETIARHLEVSLRTARRRIAALMRKLGADNRFQAGYQAAKRNLIP